MEFEKLFTEGHEQVVFYNDPSCNLKAIVAIHDTTLGQALGGTRMWPYGTMGEAVTDVLRLSRGMTYKAAVSGLNLGGGKAVIIGDPKRDKSEALFRSYGRFISSLEGHYVTAEDVSMTEEDMGYIFMETSNVVGISKANGGGGDPSPFTARGVLRGMEASCAKVFGSKSVRDRLVVVQGAGSVGTKLARLLQNEGAEIIFTDINSDNIDSFKAEVPRARFAEADEIYDIDCDIYAPCALGASINDDTVEKLKCQIVCGSANNQLAEPRHGDILDSRGILYAPDYLVNAGGLISVSLELDGWTESRALSLVDTIFESTQNVFSLAEQQGIPIYKAADALAENRINAMREGREYL